MYLDPSCKNPIFFTFFIFSPMVAQVKIHKCLIQSYTHHLPPNVLLTSLYGKNWNFFYTHLWLTTHFVPPRAQIPQIIVRQPQFNNELSDSHKQNTKIFLSTSSLLYWTPVMSKKGKKKKLKKIIWKKSIFFTFFTLSTSDPNGAHT